MTNYQHNSTCFFFVPLHHTLDKENLSLLFSAQTKTLGRMVSSRVPFISCCFSAKNLESNQSVHAKRVSDLQVKGIALPMMDTSYSTRSVASWPHCLRMLIASAWEVPCKRIPSMLSSRSPGLTVPSLEEKRKKTLISSEGNSSQKELSF